MAFLFGAGAVLVLLASLVGWVMGLATRRTAPPVRVAIHLALLALSLAPIALHAGGSARAAATFGAPAIDPVGLVPELKNALIATFAVLAVLFGVGAIASRWYAPIAAAVPAAAFTAYYMLILPMFSAGAIMSPLDNVPNVWLFLYEGAFCILLAAHAIAGRVSASSASNSTRTNTSSTDNR